MKHRFVYYRFTYRIDPHTNCDHVKTHFSIEITKMKAFLIFKKKTYYQQVISDKYTFTDWNNSKIEWVRHFWSSKLMWFFFYLEKKVWWFSNCIIPSVIIWLQKKTEESQPKWYFVRLTLISKDVIVRVIFFFLIENGFISFSYDVNECD